MVPWLVFISTLIVGTVMFEVPVLVCVAVWPVAAKEMFIMLLIAIMSVIIRVKPVFFIIIAILDKSSRGV